MEITLQFTCSHVTDECREGLNQDSNKPTLASCLACMPVMFNSSSVLDLLISMELLPVTPGSTLGQALFGATVLGKDKFGLGLEAFRTTTGMLGMMVNGKIGGSLYIVRRTMDGLLLLFPGSSDRWADRVVHPDDIFWFFGDTITDERVPKGEKTIHELLREGIGHDGFVLNVRSLARVG